jgi:hypothetical protein
MLKQPLIWGSGMPHEQRSTTISQAACFIVGALASLKHGLYHWRVIDQLRVFQKRSISTYRRAWRTKIHVCSFVILQVSFLILYQHYIGPTIRDIGIDKTSKVLQRKGFWNDILISQDVLGGVCDFVWLGLCNDTARTAGWARRPREMQGGELRQTYKVQSGLFSLRWSLLSARYRSVWLSRISRSVSSLLVSNRFVIIIISTFRQQVY